MLLLIIIGSGGLVMSAAGFACLGIALHDCTYAVVGNVTNVHQVSFTQCQVSFSYEFRSEVYNNTRNVRGACINSTTTPVCLLMSKPSRSYPMEKMPKTKPYDDAMAMGYMGIAGSILLIACIVVLVCPIFLEKGYHTQVLHIPVVVTPKYENPRQYPSSAYVVGYPVTNPRSDVP